MLKGKVAVVTGGTRGIGYCIVKKYLENGAKVILFGSRKETVDKALDSLKAENAGWEVEGMYPALTNPKEVEAAIKQIKDKYGKIDILVNNAGISQSTPLCDYTPEEFNKVCNILAEYAHQEKYSSAIRAYFEEHYDVILKKDALQVLSRI